jgi:hypothetical protein
MTHLFSKLSAICFCIILISFSCKKDNSNKKEPNYKMEVIAGNNQSDTVGQKLTDSIKIRVLSDNAQIGNLNIRVVQPGCALTTEYFLRSDSNGIASFSWQLTPTIGDQVLKFSLINSSNIILDSTVANAKGLYFEHCWLPADCVPNNASTQSLAELSDGTLLCGLGKVYASRDHGHSWYYHPTYPNQLSTYKVINYENHVFALSNMNIQHSPDNGIAWESVGASLSTINNEPFEVSNKGKLFISKISGVYMSTDFGQIWKNISTVTNGLGYSTYYYDFSETLDGRIYAVNNRHELWTSSDGGNTWTSSFANYGYVSVFVDDNDDVYIAKVGPNQGELYRKRANESTSTLICTFTNNGSQPAEITQISKVNSFFYFLVAGHGLMKTSDFTTFQNLRSYPIQTYLITKSNTALVAGAGIEIGKILYNTNP